jgi:uncharacterized protein
MNLRHDPYGLACLFLFDDSGACYAFHGDSMLLAEVSKDVFHGLGCAKECGYRGLRDRLATDLGEHRAAAACDSIQKLIDAGFCTPRVPQDALCEKERARIDALLASPPAPTVIQLAVSGECTLRCEYCYAGFGRFLGSSRSRFVELETVQRAVCLLSNAAVQNVGVGLLGGEPLLHPQLGSILSSAREQADQLGKTITFSLDTNGTCLSSEHLELLSRYHVNVSVSLDGPPDVQNQQRPYADGSPSYETVARTIRRLAAALGPERVTVNMTCTPRAFRKAIEFRESVDRVFGPVNTKIAPAIVPPSHPGYWTAPLAEEWRTLVRRRVGQELRRSLDVEVLEGALRDHVIWKRGVKCSLCAFSATQLAVSVDGDVYPCIGLIGRSAFRLGNVHAGPLSRPPAVEDCVRRATVAFRDECSVCWAKYLCSGGCPVVSLMAADDYTKPIPETCSLFRAESEGRLLGFLALRRATTPSHSTKASLC